MNDNRNIQFGQRGFSMGNMLCVLAIAGSLYVAKGKFSGPDFNGQLASQVVQELGEPVAKESIPRPS